MSQWRVFVGHELATQIRSARFHGTTLAYLAVTTAPAVAAFVLSRRMTEFLSSGTYGLLLDSIQPLVTTLYGAAIAVDAIARERDENSLGVVAMAPISAAGYVLHRWLAIVSLLLPVTLIPRLVAIALVAHAERQVPEVASICLGWLLHVMPVLLVVTALAIALGTITNRVVLALLSGLAIFTIFVGIANDLLAYAHRQIDGAGDFFGFSNKSFLLWFLRRYYDIDPPTAAGYPLARELDAVIIEGALAAGIAALLLGISCAYLRRTKRDIRPWRIREDHPLRSFHGTLNRLREEFTPDGGLEIPERVAIVLGLIVPIAALVMITRRYDSFEALAAERYAAETRGVEPMPLTILPVTASLRGRVASDGELDATATLTMRNDGDAPQRHLAFSLNRGIVVGGAGASRGAAKVDRVWERLGIALDPPLAPRESRTITLAMRGAPGNFEFSLPYGRDFGEKWRRYLRGKLSIELADLSRSRIVRDASSERLYLAGASLFPVPRYSPWRVDETPRWRATDAPRTAFLADTVRPPSAMSIDLEIPKPFMAIDACGTVARGRVRSRCTFPLGDYVVIATRYATMTVAGGIRLAYLPPHAELARTHAPSISGALALAKEAWPSFELQDRAVFVERPSWHQEDDNEWSPVGVLRSVRTHGAMTILPEPMMLSLRPLDRNGVAAALIASNLLSRRPVARYEQGFFRGFYETLAAWRTGGRRPTAVEPPGQGRPETDPIIESGSGSWNGPVRLRRVLVDIDYRVGTDRLMAGVEDFLAAGPGRGTAKELVDAIARRGGISLDRYYADYFLGRELPKLTLADVTFARTDGGWEARGRLANEAGGEVFCPVVLRTAAGAVRTTLRVDAMSSTPFVLRTPHEPRTLQLDPEKVVYRHAAVGLVQSVDYKEPSS